MADITLTSKITVKPVSVMGNDQFVIGAMRTMDGVPVPDPSDRGRIRYLMQHRHGTPFEHNGMVFQVHAPIFVWREWHRHRIGFCLAGDSLIWGARYTTGFGTILRKMPLADLCDRWNNGVLDSLGRRRHLPSIKQQTLRVLNEETHLFETGRIEDVFETGIKEVFLLQTRDHRGFHLRGSKDHRVLTPDGWAKLEELGKRDCIYVSGKRNASEVSVPPSLRRGIGVWTSMQRTKLIRPYDSCYICGNRFPRDSLTLDHVIPVVENLTKALDKNNLKPACVKCHRDKSNSEQKLAERNIVAGSKLVRIKGKPQRVSEEMTYDIAMQGPHHNFVANGVIVHNSYNEESARYKTLDPVFYVPSRDRPMMKVGEDKWKPARPKFERDETGITHYDLTNNLEWVYRTAYKIYLANLSMGVDPGLARDCLPVGIYSSCWVTCNLRSAFAFLSLRTFDQDARYISYPLYEIEQAARQVEDFVKEHFPLCHEAWNDFGRVAP